MSDEEDKSQKTEQATPQKLEKARKEGQVTISKEINHWFMLFTFALLLVYILPSSLQRLSHLLQFYFDHATDIPVTSGGLRDLFGQTIWSLFKILSLPILFLSIAAITGGLVQTKGLVSLKSMAPKMSKISPMAGFKRLFGPKALVELLKNMVKLTIIITIAYFMMRPEFDRLHALPQLSAFGIVQELKDLLLQLLIVVVSILTFIAGLDYSYQKYKFMEDQKMSKKDIKDEQKDSDGDPHVKAKLRQIRADKANQRMMQDVPSSTVILTNPTHYAVALKYEMNNMEIPTVVAKGTDAVALRIREMGEEHDIPIIESPPLTRALYANVPIGEGIPKPYFDAVARVIRYIYGYENYYQSHLDDDVEHIDLKQAAKEEAEDGDT